MLYVTEQIVESLRESRIRKGLSQRELSARSGVPQSHISKIESGGVDLRISSLIALARVLDLELFVAPKKSVPAIKSIIRSSKDRTSTGSHNEDEQRSPAYRLDGDNND
ncbi:XRE family transcriptional regulator [Marinomonas agarivorans]|nr:XRE family transcriptional regulator [Marinomonas agarivorans]